MSRVLFVCVHNAGRSQMSQALFNRLAGPGHEARSAGSDPGADVHPEVVEAMDELGIDLRGEMPVGADRCLYLEDGRPLDSVRP